MVPPTGSIQLSGREASWLQRLYESVSLPPLPPPYSWPPLQSPTPSNSWEILLNSPQGSTQGSIFSLELQNTCFFPSCCKPAYDQIPYCFLDNSAKLLSLSIPWLFPCRSLDKSTAPHLPCFIPLFSLVAEELLLALQGKSAISPTRQHRAAARALPEVLVPGADVLRPGEVRRHNSLQGS